MGRDSILRPSAERSTAVRAAAIRRLAPLAVLLAAVGAFFAFGLHHYLSFEALRQNPFVSVVVEELRQTRGWRSVVVDGAFE